MRARSATAVLLLLAVAGCGGTVPGVPTGTSGAGATSGPSTAGPSAGAAINLSEVDACALVPEATVEALTGETGFKTTKRSDASSSSCFWAVPRPGVPQYLDVQIARRAASLGDFTLNVNGAACPGAAVPGIGAEARGGVCVGAQSKVWVIGMDRGVSVLVIVNEPKSSLTPADLVAVATAVLAGLGLG